MGGGAGQYLLTQRGLRPGIPIQLGFNRHQGAVSLRSNFHPDLGGVAFGVHQQALMPVKGKLDRASGSICQQSSMNLSGDILFTAEPTATSLPDPPHPFVGPAQRGRHLGAIGIGDL